MSKPVQPIRPAATIILARDSAPQGLELFMLRRTMGSAFAGGMYVFPGGRVEGDDHLHAYDPFRTGPSEAQQPQLDAIGHEWRGFWIAAIRETFEEAGVLLAYNDLGQLVTFFDVIVRVGHNRNQEIQHADDDNDNLDDPDDPNNPYVRRSPRFVVQNVPLGPVVVSRRLQVSN